MSNTELIKTSKTIKHKSQSKVLQTKNTQSMLEKELDPFEDLFEDGVNDINNTSKVILTSNKIKIKSIRTKTKDEIKNIVIKDEISENKDPILNAFETYYEENYRYRRSRIQPLYFRFGRGKL